MKILKFLILTFIVFNLYATEEAKLLIREMEALLKDLPQNDKSRLPLSLKLADIYFNQATIDKDEGIDKLHAFKSSIKYYRTIDHTKVNSNKSVSIDFQLGRLYHRYKEYQPAITQFKKVLNNVKAQKSLRKESALYLAELYETLVYTDEAEKYYDIALTYCDTQSLCTYGHYKKAWLYYRSARIDRAVEEIEKALFDEEGQLKEKSLRDYFLFLSQLDGNGEVQIEKIIELEKKTERWDLLETMGHGFYAAGNREAGTRAFYLLSKREPLFKHQIRLLEEYYGFRNFEKFEEVLSQIEKATLDTSSDELEAKESLKTFRRLIVQLDSERKSNSNLAPYLRRVISLYLKNRPYDELRKKMINGWLNASTNDQENMSFLTDRILEERDNELLKEWSLKRIVLSQKLNYPEMLLIDAGLLESLEQDQAKKRKWQYIQAKAHYDLKNYKMAKPGFEFLSHSSQDDFSIKAHNLLIDIYNVEENFSAIVFQINKFILSHPSLEKKEQAEQVSFKNQSQFQSVVSLGKTKEALALFLNYCKTGFYRKKSCANAKAIASELDDRQALVSLYLMEGNTGALEQEYEYIGEFVKTARIKENKLTKSSAITEYLQIAVLYELEGQETDQKRVLKKLVKKLTRNSKKLDRNLEALVYSTLYESGLLDSSAIQFNWSKDYKDKLLVFLHEHGLHSKHTYKMYINHPQNLGRDWEKVRIEPLFAAYEKQRKYSFYGRYSRYRFQKRVNMLSKLKTDAQKSMDKFSLDGKFLVSNMLEEAYTHFSEQIKNTPIPKDLEEDQVAQIQQGLADMTAPFLKEAESIAKVKNEIFLNIELKRQEELLAYTDSRINIDEVYRVETKVYEEETLKDEELANVLETFKKDPQNLEKNVKLKNFFEKTGSDRLSSFIQGRINSLEKEQSL